MRDLVNDYVALVGRVRDTGKLITARGLATRELTAITLIFPDLLAPMLPIGTGRGVNTRLAALEALQLISGEDRHDLIKHAAPGFADVLVDSQDPAYGAYGPRAIEQIVDAVELLKVDPLTRQAVVAIWRPEDLTHRGDKPCTVFLQFIIRPDDETTLMSLELHTHMRSQDVWLGVPYDVFMFTQLQLTVAAYLKMPVGRYVHHTTSLHLYERNVMTSLSLRALDSSNTGSHDLPHGVVVPAARPTSLNTDDDYADTPWDIATYLLDNSVHSEERAANRWYDAQLALLDESIGKTTGSTSATSGSTR